MCGTHYLFFFYSPSHHSVEFPWLVEHDHVAGKREELQIGLWYGPLHLAHLHQGHEGVLQAVHQQSRAGDTTVEVGIACDLMKNVLSVRYVRVSRPGLFPHLLARSVRP